MADISSTLVSNSTQLDNVDLMGGPRVFTIVDVTVLEGSEQPLIIRLAEYDRPWKPGVTMRRLLAEMWGPESDAWIGRRVRLFRDDTVTFGRDKTGGTRISHASHLDKLVVVTLPISKGKFGEFKVAPLIESSAAAPPEPTAEQVATCSDLLVLQRMWDASGPGRRSQIEARKAEIAATPQTGGGPVERETSDGPPSTSPAVEPTPSAPQDGARDNAPAGPTDHGEPSSPGQVGPASTSDEPRCTLEARTALGGQLERLGVKDNAEKGYTIGVLVGRKVEASKHLSVSEADRLLAELGSFKDGAALQDAVIAADEAAAR